jgi:hypothetical protein
MCKYYPGTRIDPPEYDYCDAVLDRACALAKAAGRPEDEPNEEDFEQADREIHPPELDDPANKYDMDPEV